MSVIKESIFNSKLSGICLDFSKGSAAGNFDSKLRKIYRTMCLLAETFNEGEFIGLEATVSDGKVRVFTSPDLRIETADLEWMFGNYADICNVPDGEEAVPFAQDRFVYTLKHIDDMCDDDTWGPADGDINDGKIEVPNVINMSYAEAVATLNKKGFKQIEKVQMSSSTVNKGNVAEQTPAAGERADKEDTIVLAVSTGAEIVQVKVPNVIGLSEMDATAVLVEHGLQVGAVTEANDPDTNLIDKVCYQSYAAEVTVESGTKVDLRISTGTGEKVYFYVGNIESPGSEDSEYAPGSEATVILSTLEGTELKRETVTSFPVSMNITGITGSGDGVITIIYNVTIPGSIDAEGNTISEATSEERTVRRSVKFSEE